MKSMEVQQIIEAIIGAFSAAVFYAMLELFLIMLLFLNGLISFAAYKLARFFGLDLPFLLCTRIDHLLVPRDPNSCYKESICDAHAKHVSALTICSGHRRLMDDHQMCDGHVLTFAAENISNLAMKKSVTAILGADDVECSWEIQLQVPANAEDMSDDNEKSSICHCSCCHKPMRKQGFDNSTSASEPLLHIDYSSEIEFDLAEQDDRSSAVISENEIAHNEKFAQGANIMMFNGSNGIQEEKFLHIESRQFSLREPYEAFDGGCNVRKPNYISLGDGLVELSDCSVVTTSSNKSEFMNCSIPTLLFL